MMSVLLEHRKDHHARMNELDEDWNPLDLIFPKKDGSPIPLRRAQKYFKRAIADASLPVIRFHDLRHTARILKVYKNRIFR